MKNLSKNRSIINYIGLIMIGIIFSIKVFSQTVTTITSFTPLSAKPGDIVTITGTGFNLVAAQNVVMFGKAKASVQSSSFNTLTVTVPDGSSHSPISVCNLSSKLIGYSSQVFIPTFNGVQYKNKFTQLTNISSAQTNFPICPSLADVDLDGKLDMITSNLNTVSVYQNISTGGTLGINSFSTKVDFQVIGTGDVMVDDLDGDGKPEIIVSTSNTISILKNNTTPGSINMNSFSFVLELITSTSTSTSQSICITDMDKDGRPDILLLQDGTNELSIFRNTIVNGVIQPNSFSSRFNIATGQKPLRMLVRDFDNDGKDDVAIIYFNTSKYVSLYRNTSLLNSNNLFSFDNRIDIPLDAITMADLACGDYNSDGKSDLAVIYTPVVNPSVTLVAIFENRSSGSSNSPLSFTTSIADLLISKTSRDLDIGDVDGDKKPDIVVSDELEKRVQIFYNNQRFEGSITQMSFTSRLDIPFDRRSRILMIKDLDSDSRQDLVMSNFDDKCISYFSSLIYTPLSVNNISPISGRYGERVSINGIGFNTDITKNIVYFGAVKARVISASNDLLECEVPLGATYGQIYVSNLIDNSTAASSQYFIPSYSGSPGVINFSNRVTYFTQTNGINSIGIGDYDLDGKPDVSITHTTDSKITLFRNQILNNTYDASSFSTKYEMISSRFNSILNVDIDADGKLDMIAISTDGRLHIFKNTSSSSGINSSTFAQSVTYSTSGVPNHLSVADIDQDGKIDIVVGNSSNVVIVYKNVINNSQLSSTSFQAINFSVATIYGMAIADIDNDYRPDLIIASHGGIGMFLNRSVSGQINNLSFSPAISAGTFPSTFLENCMIATADINKDNKIDILVTDPKTNSLFVIPNNSINGRVTQNAFFNTYQYSVGTFPTRLTVGDLDGDTYPDVVTTNKQDNTISILRNSANPTVNQSTFTSKLDIQTSFNPYALSICDFNGDQTNDIIVNNVGTSSFSIYPNINIVTSIKSITNNEIVGLYPNPGRNYLSVKIEKNKWDYLIISNMQGEQLYKQSIIKNKSHVTLNTMYLKNGTYHITLYNSLKNVSFLWLKQ